MPHLSADAVVQHITFHLADSLPLTAVEGMRRDLEALPEERRARERRERIQDLLDAGSGSCVLRRDDCAQVVQDALLFGDGPRYRLLAWVVMPNHVHVLIQLGGWPMAKVVQSWKRHTAREIHRLIGAESTATLWQRDYWDRFIRDEEHLRAAIRYIEQNPVKAGLVQDTGAWRWSHLARGRDGGSRPGS